MKKIFELIHQFIYGLDIADEKKGSLYVAVEFTYNGEINSLMVYDQSISNIDEGLSNVYCKDKNIKCKEFEIIWQDNSNGYEWWLENDILEMRLNSQRLRLMQEIIAEICKYNEVNKR